jgi:hypothetical protein
MTLTYTKAERLWLKSTPGLSEAWVRDRIVEDPAILGLGELDVRAIERSQPRAGRLDLLLSDPEAEKWYEVELMLGTVDESHIIRTIEYWDIERRRYPQYEHVAVIVAEDITTRFLNVINLFNSAIPLIAIQMNALKLGDQVILHFTKVLDEVIRGEEPTEEITVDRAYWERLASKESLQTMDSCFALLQGLPSTFKLNYKKRHIGLIDETGVNNFVVFRPWKRFLVIRAALDDRQAWRERLEDAGMPTLPDRRNCLRFQVRPGDFAQHQVLIRELFTACYQEQAE